MATKPAGELVVGDRVRFGRDDGSVVYISKARSVGVQWDKGGDIEVFARDCHLDVLEPDIPFAAALVRADEVRPGDVLEGGLVVGVEECDKGEPESSLQFMYANTDIDFYSKNAIVYRFGRLAR